MRAVAGMMLVLLLGACRAGSSTKPSGPWLQATWSGAATGGIAAPAIAEWCDTLHLLEIRAVHGDTGVALALYPSEAMRPGAYPVQRPELADSIPPAAAVAVRWFGETTIQAYQGQSGQVVIDRGGRTLSGRFEASSLPPGGTGKLKLSGWFRDLSIRPAARGCVARGSVPPAPPASDSGVH